MIDEVKFGKPLSPVLLNIRLIRRLNQMLVHTRKQHLMVELSGAGTGLSVMTFSQNDSQGSVNLKPAKADGHPIGTRWTSLVQQKTLSISI